MIIQSYGDDIPILLFKRVIGQQHIDLMLNEIDLLNKSNLFRKGSETNSALNELNKPKDNVAIFLDDIYLNGRNRSTILSIHQNIINKKISKHFANRNIVFQYFEHTNRHVTLLNAYMDGDSYFEHQDNSVLSSLTFLWNEPKKFNGGHLKFNEYNIEIEPELGDVVFFPGFCDHEVTKVGCNRRKKYCNN